MSGLIQEYMFKEKAAFKKKLDLGPFVVDLRERQVALGV
jgi:hypothetical protein